MRKCRNPDTSNHSRRRRHAGYPESHRRNRRASCVTARQGWLRESKLTHLTYLFGKGGFVASACCGLRH
jgi:hypothetical protein